MNKAVLAGGNTYAAHKELSELFDDGWEYKESLKLNDNGNWLIILEKEATRIARRKLPAQSTTEC